MPCRCEVCLRVEANGRAWTAGFGHLAAHTDAVMAALSLGGAVGCHCLDCVRQRGEVRLMAVREGCPCRWCADFRSLNSDPASWCAAQLAVVLAMGAVPQTLLSAARLLDLRGADDDGPSQLLQAREEAPLIVKAHTCAHCGREVDPDKATRGLPRAKYLRVGARRTLRRGVLRTFCSKRCLKAAEHFAVCAWCQGRGEHHSDDAGEIITCAHCFGTGWATCAVCGERATGRQWNGEPICRVCSRGVRTRAA